MSTEKIQEHPAELPWAEADADERERRATESLERVAAACRRFRETLDAHAAAARALHAAAWRHNSRHARCDQASAAEHGGPREAMRKLGPHRLAILRNVLRNAIGR